MLRVTNRSAEDGTRCAGVGQARIWPISSDYKADRNRSPDMY